MYAEVLKKYLNNLHGNLELLHNKKNTNHIKLLKQNKITKKTENIQLNINKFILKY